MNKLTENHFSFKCPMSWDEMEVSGAGRHCAKCRKQVFDLTNCSIDEVIALQRKHGPICGSIKVAQAAVAAISLSAAACQNTSDSQVLGGPVLGTPVSLKPGDTAINRNSIDGVVFPPEQLEKMKGE